MYAIGEYVVKANTGICRVKEIVRKRLTEYSDEKDYYMLVPLDDLRSQLFVPVESDKANMRPAMNREEAWSLIYSIPDIEMKWIESDKMREQEYKNVMKSNDPVALVSIIKNLYVRNRERERQGKKVTAVDDRYFKMAENALYSEVAHAIGKRKDDMRDIINDVIENRNKNNIQHEKAV